MKIDNETVFVAYEDDGPMGACGQAVSITSPHKILYLCKNYDEARIVVEMIENNRWTGRKNARVTGVWMNDDCLWSGIVEASKGLRIKEYLEKRGNK